MNSSDNPIGNIVNDVLGLGGAPKSFSDKVRGLRETMSLGNPNLIDRPYVDLMRADKGFSALQGSTRASTPEHLRSMFSSLHKAGLVPESASTVFENVASTGGSMFYSENTRSLHYGTGDNWTALPLAGEEGSISVGGRARKVNSLLREYETGPRVTSFLEEYYSDLGQGLTSNMGSIHRANRNVLRSTLGTYMMEGTSTRGVMTPEESFWTSNRSVLQPTEQSADFFESLGKYRVATSARSQLVKTGGRSVSDALKDISGNEYLTTQEAFGLIDKYTNEYSSQLGQMLSRTGSLSSFVYTKPDFLGTKDKILLSGQALGRTYGTKFESHILTKGLYQLAKLKRGTEGGAVAPYLLKGQNDLYRSMGLNVAVVDTQNQAISKLLFQEGGALITPVGEAKLAYQAPKGTMKFGSPSENLIGAVERLYGVNMGAGYVQTPGAAPRFTSADYTAAMAGGPDLSDIQKDIRFLSKSSQQYKGVLQIAAKDQAVLGKIQLTDSQLKLDFLSKGSVLPEGVEMLAGARRFTGVVPGGSNPLRGLINELGMQGADLVVGADEYMKMHGPDVFLTNFIQKVQGTQNAEQIFDATFKQGTKIAVNHKQKTVIPYITNHDEAFEAAQSMVAKWKVQGNLQQRRLAHEIEHGSSVVFNNFRKLGIKGISMIGMQGGLRTDFMGDINMMKPVSMSPGKMMTIASGARQLGYTSQYDDPLYSSAISQNFLWRNKFIGTRAGSGNLFLSDKHLMKRFSTAMAGGTPDMYPSEIITMKGGSLYQGGTKLDALPGMDEFRHSSGGVGFDRLKNTILGQKRNMLYLDMGSTQRLDLLGTGARDYRYLPIPLEYLRVQKGPHDRLVLNKTNPAYGFVESLVNMQQYPSRSHEKALQQGYSSLLRSIGGNQGIFNKSNSILMKMGSRVRLAPQAGDHFGMGSWDTTDNLYDAVISQGGFEDYLTRKKGVSRNQANRLRSQVKDKGFFYASLIADPMQRAEHAEIYKVLVNPGEATERLGQLNLSLHPHAFSRFERDVDRDAISMVPLTSTKSGSAMEELFQDRIERQKKLMAHSLWFDKYQNMAQQVDSSGRLSNLAGKIDPDQAKYLPTYMGATKSLGYSTVRSSDTIMSNIAAYGVKGAQDLGILSKDITPGMVEQIAAPFKANPEEFSVVQRSLQNLYQGAVQKGTSKAGLANLTERLITDVGQKYSGDKFDIEAVYGDTKAILRDYLTEDGMKDRLFADMDYLVTKGDLPAESVKLMQQDLERGLTETLDRGTLQRMKAFRGDIIEAQADLMARYMGPAMVLASSVKRAPKGVIDVVRKFMSGDVSPEELQSSILETTSGVKYGAPRKGFEKSPTLAADQATELKGGTIDEDSIFKKFKTFFGSSKGKTFGLGVAAGAVAGAGLHAMVSGPDVPMPRQIDSRQPTDVGPTVFSSAPKIYGTNQNFYASQRKTPETFSPMGSYSFPGTTDSSVTIRDKRAPNNPYLLASQMRQISNSDYTY